MPTITIANGVPTLGGTIASGDTLFVQGGSQYIQTNVDQSGLANGLVLVRVFGGFRGRFGSAATPFYVEITSKFVNEAQAGDIYYKGKDGGDATPLIQHLGDSHFHFIDGTGTAAHASAGQFTVEDGAVVVSMYVAGGIVNILNAGSATVPTLLEMEAGPNGVGGLCYTERSPTTATNKAGNLTLNGTGAITTLNCEGPASNSRTIIQNTGTITAANLLGHIPDLSTLENIVTITDTTINMSLPGAGDFLANPKLTFTNTPTRRFSSGE